MSKQYNIDFIKTIQQNRYPMLFIDVITEIIPGKMAAGYKNFSYNEWYFPVHFENDPIVPGFVLSEAMSQTFLMAILTIQGLEGKKAASSRISNIVFRKPVRPGDRVYFEAQVYSYNRGVAKGVINGNLNNVLVCSQNVEILIPDVLSLYKVEMK